MRNTITELKNLDKCMSEDFQYIINRHGLIVIGYAGRDAGIMAHLLNRNNCGYNSYWQYVDLPQENEEYKYFYELKNKYEENKIITFIEQPSASAFLSEINEGLDRFELFIQTSNNDNDYNKIVESSDEKKLRGVSNKIINLFDENFKKYLNLERSITLYEQRFDNFQTLLNENSFIINYFDSLLTYESKESLFLFEKCIKIIIPFIDNDIYDDFIKTSYPYYFILHIGSLAIKHNSELLLVKIMKSTYINKYNTSSYLLSEMYYNGNGWQSIGINRYNLKYKYEIIRAHLLNAKISKYDFDSFDSFILLYKYFNNVELKWYSSAGHYRGYFFLDVYTKYFENESSVLESLEIINKIKSDFPYEWSWNSFDLLFSHLEQKNKQNP